MCCLFYLAYFGVATMAIIFLSALDIMSSGDIGQLAHNKWNRRCQLMANVYGEHMHCTDDAYQNFWYGESKEVSLPVDCPLSSEQEKQLKDYGFKLDSVAKHNNEEIVVVTRHKGMEDYLVHMGYVPNDCNVIGHVIEPSMLKDKTVWGVLPHSLSSLCSVFCEVPLNLPPEFRGKELSMEEMSRFAGPAKCYQVKVVPF